MKKKLIVILGITLIVVISGGFFSWFFFFNQPPTQPDDSTRYPDLTISNYTLENNNLTITIANNGNASTQGAGILVTVSVPTILLYSGQASLDLKETFVFTINLMDFKDYFISGNTYDIWIQLDAAEEIDELSEDNNFLSLEYYYEGEFQPLSPNTYSFNSTITNFAYAVRFNATQILLEDSLHISNGAINGYNLINSTILENSTVINSDYRLIIALHGNQNLTLRNIWNSQLSIVLNDLSSVSLFNCSIQELAISGDNDICMSNSTLYIVSSVLNLTNFANFRIENNSSIEMCILSTPGVLDIEFSSFGNLYIIISTNDLYAQHSNYLVTGTIKNCSIHNLMAYGQTNFDISGTDVSQVNAIGNTRLNFIQCVITEENVNQHAISILNNTQVLSELSYGIIITSGLVNLVDGQVQGSSYINNTVLINANVSNTVLSTIVVNNTGQAYISNFSDYCTLFLYNDANVVVNDSTIANEYGVYLEGTASLTGINSSFGFIYSTYNSSLDLSGGSVIQSCLLNNSNDILINNCSIDQLAWYSITQTGRTSQIINSTIVEFLARPSAKVDIIDCSIDMLYDGITIQGGINYLNSSGIFGSGIVHNSLNLTNSVISNSTNKFIDIEGDASVEVEDIHDLLSIVIESGNLTLTNSTFDSLQLRNNAIVHLDNCSTPEGGGFTMLSALLNPPAFIVTDNSHLYLNNSRITDKFMLTIMQSAQATISYSEIFGISVLQESKAVISFSEFYLIRISSFSPSDYAATLMNCQIENLASFGWTYS